MASATSATPGAPSSRAPATTTEPIARASRATTAMANQTPSPRPFVIQAAAATPKMPAPMAKATSVPI